MTALNADFDRTMHTECIQVECAFMLATGVPAGQICKLPYSGALSTAAAATSLSQLEAFDGPIVETLNGRLVSARLAFGCGAAVVDGALRIFLNGS